MKRNSLMIVFFIISISCSLHTAAQSNIWINGYTYTEEAGKQIMIPFATISVYDYIQTDQLKYFVVSGPCGNYRIKPYDYKKQYRFVVEAPGYKTRTFNVKEVPEIVNAKPFSGNSTIHILMEKDTMQSVDSLFKTIYMKEELEKTGKVKLLPELLSLLPKIRKEGEDWITIKREGSVCLFLNGLKVDSKALSTLNELPTNVVSSLEYYQLPQGGTYDAAVNIVLSIGQKASMPTYELMQSSLIF